MRDIFYQQNEKGTWIFKALTERGLFIMGSSMGGPWRLAKKDGVFAHVEPGKFQKYMEMLHANNLQTEDEHHVDVSVYTDF